MVIIPSIPSKNTKPEVTKIPKYIRKTWLKFFLIRNLYNKEKIVEYKKCYHQNNPHKQFNANAKRRELEEKQGRGINKEQWQEMMCYFNWECAYSGISLNINNRTIDHIISLNKNGEHEIWNCVPMYSNYNYSKHNYDMLTWYKKQEFYSEERLRKIYEWIEYAKNKWGTK